MQFYDNSPRVFCSNLCCCSQPGGADWADCVHHPGVRGEEEDLGHVRERGAGVLQGQASHRLAPPPCVMRFAKKIPGTRYFSSCRPECFLVPFFSLISHLIRYIGLFVLSIDWLGLKGRSQLFGTWYWACSGVSARAGIS